MMDTTGCGHDHPLLGEAEDCLARANRRAAPTDPFGYIANSGLFRSDGSDLNKHEAEALVYDLHRDRDGRPIPIP